jgi:regulation of enolase protein 1 (concanavalin A-like superfamily)
MISNRKLVCGSALVVWLALASHVAAQTPISGWTSVDIGGGAAGWTNGASNGFTVHAAGDDVWNRSDQFRFVYRPLTGDGVIIARVANLVYVDAWTKAGLMVRESLAPDSKYSFMLVSGTQGVTLQGRRLTGDWATLVGMAAWAAGPVWLKLERQGSALTGSVSSDGVTWYTIGRDTITMNATVYVGVALSSHLPSAYASADFTNVFATQASNWASSDIGPVALNGTTSTASGGVSITAAGTDIWGTSDEFRFVYQQLTGDGSIVARVATLTAADLWTKAGIMIRESLASNSRHALMALTGSQGLTFQRRAAGTGSATTHTYAGAAAAPVWLRMDRHGSRLTAYFSLDGFNWTPAGSDTIAMSSTVLVGLALTSHSTWAYAAADFTDISITAASTWTSQDVGAVSLAGSTSTVAGGYSITASGVDVWDTSDQFRFAYQQMTGDGAIVARVDQFTAPDVWSKTGVMMRDTLASNAKHAFMLLSGSGSLAFQRRANAGGTSAHTAGPQRGVPVWVKLQRQGATLTGLYSHDGVNWITVGTDTIAMEGTVFVGLAVTSHVATAYASAAFSNIGSGPSVVTNNQPPLVSVTAPAAGATFAAPATISLTATASDPDGSVAVVEFYANAALIGSDSSSPYSATWTNVAVGTYSLTAVARDQAGGMTVSSDRVITVTNVAQSSSATFTPSSNHSTAVSGYVLEVFPVGANPNNSSPAASLNLGLPPIQNGQCIVNVAAFLTTLRAGVYVATVTAVGPGGSARSAPSNQFAR